MKISVPGGLARSSGAFLAGNTLRRITTLAILAVLAMGCGIWVWSSNGKHISGSSACIALVKQIEGAKFDSIYTLKCTLEPRKIANSNLNAQYYNYSGFFKDPEGCSGSLDSATFPPLPPCPGGNGVILSNGQRYAGLGTQGSIDDRPFDYDECYNGTGGIDVLDPPVPTTRDLYFYKGDLWDRDIYRNSPVKTVIGTCLVNGTTLTNYSHTENSIAIYTNVIVSYPNFPNNCSGVPIGSDGDDFYKCVNLVTAARGDLVVCRSGLDIVQTKDFKIKGYKQGAPGMATPWCESSYVQRMAALHACDTIADIALRDKCSPLVYHPYAGTTRVFGKI